MPLYLGLVKCLQVQLEGSPVDAWYLIMTHQRGCNIKAFVILNKLEMFGQLTENVPCCKLITLCYDIAKENSRFIGFSMACASSH